MDIYNIIFNIDDHGKKLSSQKGKFVTIEGRPVFIDGAQQGGGTAGGGGLEVSYTADQEYIESLSNMTNRKLSEQFRDWRDSLQRLNQKTPRHTELAYIMIKRSLQPIVNEISSRDETQGKRAARIINDLYEPFIQ